MLRLGWEGSDQCVGEIVLIVGVEQWETISGLDLHLLGGQARPATPPWRKETALSNQYSGFQQSNHGGVKYGAVN